MDPLTARLQRLMDYVEARLEADGRPVVSAEFAPGEAIVWDYCCDDGVNGDGQLRIALAETYPRPAGDRQPDRVTPGTGCLAEMEVHIQIGIARCSQAFAGNSGAPPSDDVLFEEFDWQARDRRSMIAALLTDFPADDGPDEDLPIRIDRWAPLGPSGGCSGGIIEATIFIDECFT